MTSTITRLFYEAALGLSNTFDRTGKHCMYFDDVNSTTSTHFPECVSERECLAVIGEALQAIANRKTIKQQQEDNDGNFEYNTMME